MVTSFQTNIETHSEYKLCLKENAKGTNAERIYLTLKTKTVSKTL